MSQKVLAALLLITGAVLVGVVFSNKIGDRDSDSEASSEQGTFSSTYAGENHSLAWECLDDHSGLASHIHTYLNISIEGVQMLIPSDTGIATEVCDGMHLIHSHDSSGKLHVETPEVEEVPLGVLFQIWDIYFAEDGIADRRIDDDHELVMTVDGIVVDSYENHILVNGQQIAIELRESGI